MRPLASGVGPARAWVGAPATVSGGTRDERDLPGSDAPGLRKVGRQGQISSEGGKPSECEKRVTRRVCVLCSARSRDLTLARIVRNSARPGAATIARTVCLEQTKSPVQRADLYGIGRAGDRETHPFSATEPGRGVMRLRRRDGREWLRV